MTIICQNILLNLRCKKEKKMIIDKIVNFFFVKNNKKEKPVQKEKPYFFKSKAEDNVVRDLFKDFVGLKEVVNLKQRSISEDR